MDSQFDSQFDIGLNRSSKDCRFCKGGKLVCKKHNNFEDICNTYLVGYKLSERKTKSWTIRQRIYTKVLCPVSEDCKQVRQTINFEFFCLVNGTQF